MNRVIRTFAVATLALLALTSTEAVAGCSFGLTEFACCSRASAFPNSPYTRFLTGCAVSKPDADARCVAGALGSSQSIKMQWNTSKCPANTAPTPPPTPSVVWGKICTVARRTSNSHTRYSNSDNPNSDFDQLCASARSKVQGGGATTHFWKSTYKVNGQNRVEASCMNGTWWGTGYGIEGVRNASAARKAGGGKGCLYKVHK